MLAKNNLLTGLAEYPEDWTVERLGDVVDINPESLAVRAEPSFHFKYIDISSVTSGDIDWNNVTTQTFHTAPSRARRIIRPNDVLLSTVRPGLQAHAFAYWQEWDGYICSTGFAVLRSKDRLDSRYLFHLIFDDIVAAQLRRLEVGSNYPAVNEMDIRLLCISLPPLPEQRRIADILDTADAAIRQTEEHIAKLKQIKYGLLHDLLTCGLDVTGRLRDPLAHPEQFKESPLGRIPGEWEVKELNQFASINYGINDAIDQTLDTGIPTITLPCVSLEGDLTLDKDLLVWTDPRKVFEQNILKKGDLLFNWRNGSQYHLGKTAYFDGNGKYTHVGFLLQVRSQIETCNSRYLWWYFQYIRSNGFFFKAKIQVNNTFNSGELAKVQIPLPPFIEQEKIIEVLDTHDALIRSKEDRLAKLRQVKQGLMDDLLTGRVRVGEK